MDYYNNNKNNYDLAYNNFYKSLGDKYKNLNKYNGRRNYCIKT